MKRNTNMKQTIITIILALVTLTTTAQVNLETNNTPGWLWEVSGNGLKQKSYLFGTCHGDGHNFTREEVLGIAGVENALKEVKTVLFEGGMDTSDVDPTAIVAEVEKLKKWLINPGPEYLMPKGTYYKPLFDTIAHFNEVTKFLSYQMKDPEYWKKNPRYWLGRLRLYIGFKLKGTPVDVVLKQETINRQSRHRGKICGETRLEYAFINDFEYGNNRHTADEEASRVALFDCTLHKQRQPVRLV